MSNPVITTSLALSDTAGEIFFNSDTVPYLQINASTGISGGAVNMSLSGSTGFGLLYDLDTQGNIGVTAGFEKLIPDRNNSIYYQSDGGVTYATQVLYSSTHSPTVLVKQRDTAVYPYSIPELGGDGKVRFHNGKWYIMHSGNSDLITSSNGLEWDSISMGATFSALTDIAFNNQGMGLICGRVTTTLDKNTGSTVISGVPLKLFLNEKIVLPIPMAGFPYVTFQKVYSVIYSTKWIAVGKTVGDENILIIESDNGLEWESKYDSTGSSISASELTPKSKIVFQPNTSTHIINLANYYLTRSAQGVWSSTSVNYTLIDCDSNDTKTIFVTTDGNNLKRKTFNNVGLSFIDEQIITGGEDLSVQWDGTKWYIITGNTNTYTSVGGTGFTLSSSTPVAGFNTDAFSNQVERVPASYYEFNTVLGDTGPFDNAVVNADPQTFESVGSTLQYVVSGATATPVRTSFATSNAYDSFDLTFRSDILSSKTVEFIAGEETFKFNIGPNGFKVPFEFETNTSQKTTPSYYSFIADGLKHARTRDKGTAYEKLKPLLDETRTIFEKLRDYSQQLANPLQPEWLNTSIEGFPTQFLNGEDGYDFGKIRSIYGCNDVLKDDPLRGTSGATYGIESLGKILADVDSSNFSNFKDEFEAACYLYGVSGTSILTSGETKIVERFNSAIETAMSKAGYTFLKSGNAKRNFINQLLKFYSMEHSVSTDASVAENLNTLRLSVFQPYSSVSVAVNKANTISEFLDYSKVDTYSNVTGGDTLITEPTYYTANSVFKVSYDTHILSFYVDSKLIHEFSVYSEEPMKIKLIANKMDSPKLSNGTYGFRNISLGENSDSSILLKHKIKDIVKTKLASSTKQSYLDKIVKMNIIPPPSFTPIDTPENLYFGVIDTDINYYYTISQFTNHVSLLKLCGTKIIQSDVPSYPEFSEDAYLTAWTDSEANTELRAFADYVGTDSVAFHDDTVFLQFQSDVSSSLTSIVDDIISSLTYGIDDIHKISDAYIAIQNLYAKKSLLTNMEPVYTTTYPPIVGKSLLLNEYSADIDRKLNQSELSTKLAGSLTCNLEDMFGSTLFNNTSTGSTMYAFLEEIKGLTGLAPLTYEKIFIEVQNAMGISLVAEKVIDQIKLLNPYSKFIDYLKTQTFFVPENNKQLDNEILNYFYGPTGSIPSGVTLPILDVIYSDHTLTPTGTNLCIYDKTFPSELKYLYDINFSKNFPNIYDGMKLWFPLQNALTDISYAESYVKAMDDLRVGTNIMDISDLDVPHYKAILTAYNAMVLPVASIPVDESGLFATLVVPRIRETLQNTFQIDVGNKNKYFTDTELALFKKHLVEGSTGTLYPGLTSGSAGDANKFYDLNSLYLKLADDYNGYIESVISTLIADVDTDPTFDSVGNLIRSIVNGGTGLTGLNEYRRATNVLGSLENTYRSMLGVSLGLSGNTGGLYAFDQYYDLHENFEDSRLRWTQMMTDLYTKSGPNMNLDQSNFCQDFIMAIPPLDTTRWTAITGNTLSSYITRSEIPGISGTTVSYGEKSFSRYNAYWKYFEDDIVSYDGRLYQCVDTNRRFATINIPPGETETTQNLLGKYYAFTPGLTDPTGPSGGTLTYTVIQESYVQSDLKLGVSSLYAWEEWHHIPGISGTTSLNSYLDNPPEEQDRNFQGYDEETSYVLKGSSGGLEVDFIFNTAPYDSKRHYYINELVRWNNSLYICRGGAELTRGVGVGQPPNFLNSSTSWTLIGLTGANTDNIPPGSNGVWKLIDSLDTTGNVFLEKAIPEYVSTKVYNLGDEVTFLGKRYQRLANGTVRLQNGSTGTVLQIPPVTTTLSDNAWIACPYVDLTQEGRNIPQYDDVYAYSSGDLVVYKNLVYKNILNQGATGLYVEGSQYSKGDVIIAFEGYKYVSLKDNNIDNPPYPRGGSSVFWTKAYDAPIQPSAIPAYNFTEDYNATYHISGGASLPVWYDGAVYTWRDPLGIDYASLDPKLSNLYKYGIVKGVDPPPPEPFNHWVVTYENQGLYNLTKGETIGYYDATKPYYGEDIVVYKPSWNSGSYFFRCTGNGYGDSFNEKGELVSVELYVGEKEIDFGRALKDPYSQVVYNETFIVNQGTNDEDIDRPKWGNGLTDDPWSTTGFCRNLRYKLASGLELTTTMLKHDRDLFSRIKDYKSNFVGKLFLNYLKASSTSVYARDVTSLINTYSDEHVGTNYNNAEFYYYSYFLKSLNIQKQTVQRLNEQNNQIYDIWLDKHYKYYKEALQKYLLNDAIKPSIKGLPLFGNELKLSPFPTDGYVLQGGIENILAAIDTLKVRDLFSSPRYGEPQSLVYGKVNIPGGVTGITGVSYTSQLGTLLPFTYFDPNTTTKVGDLYFETTLLTYKGSFPISLAVPGYSNAVAVEQLNLAAIAAIIGKINCCIGKEKLSTIFAKDRKEDNYSSWYRKEAAVKTGTDYPILVPIITTKDKEFCEFDPTKAWVGTDRYSVDGFKKNSWYTGSYGHLKQDQGFYVDTTWGQESFLHENLGAQGQTGPEHKRYLFESLNFDLKPNYYRFNEVEETYNQLFGSSGYAGFTGITLVNASNYNYWDSKVSGSNGIITVQPFGSIDRNVASWAREKDWFGELETAVIAATALGGPAAGYLVDRARRPVVLKEKVDAYWSNTRYNPKNPVAISKEDLWRYQGKKPFKHDQNYMSILQYINHIKKCSQVEADSVLPNIVAIGIRDANYDQEFENQKRKLMNDYRVIMIIVLVVIAVGSTIASFFSAGAASPVTAWAISTIGSVLGTGVSVSTTVFVAITTFATIGLTTGLDAILKESGNQDKNPFSIFMTLKTDPGRLFFPRVETDAGLIARCSLLSQFAEQTNLDIGGDSIDENPLRAFIAPALNPITYQQYHYARLAQQELYRTFGKKAFSSSLIEDVVNVDIGNVQVLATQGISGSGVMSKVTKLPTDYKTYVEYNSVYEGIISKYEEQLFFPKLIRQPPEDRNAVLKITHLQWEPDSVNLVTGQAVLGATGPRPSGSDGTCYVKINIEDPGEGFYDYDESGNIVSYFFNNPSPNRTNYIVDGMSGASFSIEDVYLVGRYCYDDRDPLKTSVKGLATFNHFDRDTIGSNGKITINWGGGPELVGKTFQVAVPTKSNMPTFGIGDFRNQYVEIIHDSSLPKKWKVTYFPGAEEGLAVGLKKSLAAKGFPIPKDLPVYRNGWTSTPRVLQAQPNYIRLNREPTYFELKKAATIKKELEWLDDLEAKGKFEAADNWRKLQGNKALPVYYMDTVDGIVPATVGPKLAEDVIAELADSKPKGVLSNIDIVEIKPGRFGVAKGFPKPGTAPQAAVASGGGAAAAADAVPPSGAQAASEAGLEEITTLRLLRQESARKINESLSETATRIYKRRIQPKLQTALKLGGMALDIYFALENIKDAQSVPPPSTNCTDLSNRGNH